MVFIMMLLKLCQYNEDTGIWFSRSDETDVSRFEHVVTINNKTDAKHVIDELKDVFDL